MTCQTVNILHAETFKSKLVADLVTKPLWEMELYGSIHLNENFRGLGHIVEFQFPLAPASIENEHPNESLWGKKFKKAWR